MRRRPTVILGVLVGLASAAAGMVTTLGVDVALKSFEQELHLARVPVPTVDVLVAAREVPLGGTITEEDLLSLIHI